MASLARAGLLYLVVGALGLSADVVVVGGGHAGCEAAAAAARLGVRTLLVTSKVDTIGAMSCNPSIGGVGKGHLVREVDALDGLIGRVIDQAGIHFRTLNQRKGPAVQGPRAQADRDIYRAAMLRELRATENLEIVEASVEDLLLEPSAAGGSAPPRVAGVRTADGAELLAPRVVVTTGTFLRGLVHVGRTSRPAGRFLDSNDPAVVEPPATALAQTLARLELPLGRLKTGTPPRLDAGTIDYSGLECQPSEMPPVPFSFVNEGGSVALADRLIVCHKTYTNAATHAIVRARAHELPAYESGGGKGAGPRYCPSLFSKVDRFPDRTGHIVWLEPEGLSTPLVYPNGISSAFPVETQLEIVRSMAGLEAAEIVRPAYDVEYDFVDPRALDHALEVRACAGLYLAGQVIGTTGYEEAASLGLAAGANAALAIRREPPLLIGRDEGYIGVLIDDLVTRGTLEPYRMFTSRAEWRLLLRADNADKRLTPRGVACGLVGAERAARLGEKSRSMETARTALRTYALPNSEWADAGFGVKANGELRTAEQILRVPEAPLKRILGVIEQRPHGWRRGGDGAGVATAVPVLGRDAIEVEIKYESYLERQEREVERMAANREARIPAELDYSAVPCLSAEEVEKLTTTRPATLHEASLIPGITPKALFYVHAHFTRRKPQPVEPASSEAAAAEALAHHFHD
jgi:tRNA uridine 5-carboxymethylaminomethyl modification enzyme